MAARAGQRGAGLRGERVWFTAHAPQSPGSRAGDEVRGPGSEVVGTMRDVSLSKFPILKQCSRCCYASIPGLLRTFY